MLGRDEVIPMYQQIADLLNKQILEGEFKAGDKIPTEVELIEQYNVSRTTVRLAVNQLIEKGLVEKKSGKGTFVKKDRLYHPLREFKSLYDTLLESNIIPETELIDFQWKEANKMVCNSLGIPLKSQVLEVTRLYHVSNSPIAFAKLSIPSKYAKHIKLDEARIHPIYQIIEKKFSFKVKQANFEIFSEKPSNDILQYLKMDEHEPILGMERILYDDKGEAAEHTKAYFRADSYRFTITIPGGNDSAFDHMNHFPLKVKKG
jgi:GntR family transcriptional regulator